MQSTATVDSRVREQKIIESALDGNQSAYEQLVSDYQNRLFWSIRGDVGCPFLAEDIVQEAFVRAFVHLKTFRHQSSFYAWLYRIALNARSTYLRKHRNVLQSESIENQAADMPSEPTESPLCRVERVEARKQVRDALEKLSQDHRTILLLREFEGFDYQTIADTLEISLGTVRSRLARARASLKRELVG